MVLDVMTKTGSLSTSSSSRSSNRELSCVKVVFWLIGRKIASKELVGSCCSVWNGWNIGSASVGRLTEELSSSGMSQLYCVSHDGRIVENSTDSLLR